MHSAPTRRLEHVVGGLIVLLVVSPARSQDCAKDVDFGFEVQSEVGSGAADCSIAVGESKILAGTNRGFWLFDSNGDEIESVLHANFFTSPIDPLSDPIVRYDSESSRFFALIMSGNLQGPNIAMAVSKTSESTLDPEDWYFYEFTDLPGKVDFPNMSIGEDYVYVTWARVGAEPLGRAVIASLTKADLIAGEEPAFTVKLIDHIEGQATSPQFRAIGCMKMYSQPSSSIGYFITDSHKESGINTWVGLWAFDPEANENERLSWFQLTVPDYNTAPIKIDVRGANSEVTCHWDFKFPSTATARRGRRTPSAPATPGRSPRQPRCAGTRST